MPKQKKKLKTGRSLLTASNLKNNQSGDENSELNAADENASTCSNASTNMSYQDLESLDDAGGKSKQDDVLDKIDNMDSQINQCLDGLIEKGFKEREDALKLLKKIFSNKFVFENLNDKIFTLTDSLLRCVKRGKTSEQLLALDVIMLTFVQIGNSSTETLSFLNQLKTPLLEIIEDEKMDSDVRAASVKALGFGIFTSNENSADSIGILDKFEAIFSGSFAKGDGTLRSLTAKTYDFHSATLATWSLLLSIMPMHVVNKLCVKLVVHFHDLLKSSDVDMRIIAGETIALLFELAQCDSHSDLASFDDDDLIELLKTLANDAAKYRSKRDKKQQRSSFRDILRTIEEGEFNNATIKFGTENLVIDNWIRRKQYDALKELLTTGMNTHLQENEFVRDVFDLGMPLVSSDSSRRANLNSMSHTQRAQFNREQFRHRTKSMNKKRDTKDTRVGSDLVSVGDDDNE